MIQTKQERLHWDVYAMPFLLRIPMYVQKCICYVSILEYIII